MMVLIELEFSGVGRTSASKTVLRAVVTELQRPMLKARMVRAVTFMDLMIIVFLLLSMGLNIKFKSENLNCFFFFFDKRDSNYTIRVHGITVPKPLIV